ncbi:hypothetical protein Tco_0602441, partial [Tanacetum coccineum]
GVGISGGVAGAVVVVVICVSGTELSRAQLADIEPLAIRLCLASNLEHVHWFDDWSDLRALPTHGEFRAMFSEALAALRAWVKGKGSYELKALYSKQAKHELLQTVREFYACKQEEGQSVRSYVLKMKSYINNLERLGQPVFQNLTVSLILVSLNKDYDSFMQNYNMHGMGKTVNELHAMVKLHEETLPKKDANPALHTI